MCHMSKHSYDTYIAACNRTQIPRVSTAKPKSVTQHVHECIMRACFSSSFLVVGLVKQQLESQAPGMHLLMLVLPACLHCSSLINVYNVRVALLYLMRDVKAAY